jgi:hypothetical protein
VVWETDGEDRPVFPEFETMPLLWLYHGNVAVTYSAMDMS